jgi:hypothetical protein
VAAIDLDEQSHGRDRVEHPHHRDHLDHAHGPDLGHERTHGDGAGEPGGDPMSRLVKRGVVRHDVGWSRPVQHADSCALQTAHTDRSVLAPARLVDLVALADRAIRGEVIDELDRRTMIALTVRGPGTIDYPKVDTSNVDLGRALQRRLGLPEDNTAALAVQQEQTTRAAALDAALEEYRRDNARRQNERFRRGFTVPPKMEDWDE